MSRQYGTPIALPADPVVPLGAATKQYVDNGIAAESTRAQAAESGRQILMPTPTLNRGRDTSITTYASGHGWTATGFASSNVNDTSDGRLSGQVLTGTTTGNTGNFPTFTKTGAPSVAIAGNCLRVWVKVDIPTNIAALTLRVADTGGLSASRYISWTVLASSGGVYRTNAVMIPPNTWTELSLSLGSAFTSGTPNLGALTEWRWIVQDNGTACTAHFGGIQMYPALSERYPNGVVCIGFDDCFAGQYSLAMNLMSSFGYQATLFPIIDQIGAGGSYTLAQLQQMVNVGWEVAPHASTLANHSGWNSLSLAQVAADVLASQAWIAAQGFGLSGAYAYPLGGFNNGVAAAVAPLVAVARTIDSTLYTETLPIGNALQVRSAAGVGGSGGIGVTTYTTASTGVLALAKAAGSLVPITIHDVSSGTSGNINQISISDLTALVTAINAAGMAVATYGEVLAYAMKGVTTQPLTAGTAITISGPTNAPTVGVTPGSFVTPAGGSASVAATTPFAHRRDTQANWFTSNPTLAAGEAAYETDTKFFKVGDGATAYTSLGYLKSPNVWTPSTMGLIAATGDGATLPSQAGITAGRLFCVQVRVEQALTANGICAAYVSATSGNTNTNSFLGVYDVATGNLLATTADLASTLTTTGGALLTPALTTPITGLKVGQAIYLAILNNYTTTGPQWISSRLYGTNIAGATGVLPRLYVSSGTYTALPASVPALSASNTNSLVWLGLTQ